MKLYKLHVHTIHYSGVRYLPIMDDVNIDYQKDMEKVKQFAMQLLYEHDDIDELDINDGWQAMSRGYGFQFMGSNYEKVLQSSSRLAEYMMDLPSFKEFI